MVIIKESHFENDDGIGITLSCEVDSTCEQGHHDLKLGVAGKNPKEYFRLQFEAQDLEQLKTLMEKLSQFNGE